MKNLFLLTCLLLFFCLLLTGCTEENNENDVDIDLTAISMTVLQAEYERIISNADDYVGKTIQVYGSYRVYLYDTDNIAHFIIVIPGDECCQMGFEFKWDGNFAFHGDYPAQNAMILITGTLGKHEVFNNYYLYIAVDDFTVVSS